MRAARPLEQRFWAKVDRRAPDECWPWIGSRAGRTDYGILRIAGRNVRAHRIAWSLHNQRPFPADLIACHSCDNPNCVNPNHIWVGTPRDNMHDMLRKGRAYHQKNPRPPNPPKPPRGSRPFTKGFRGTHCKRGHAYADQRPYASERDIQRCRICHYASTYAAHQRRKGAMR